MSTLNKRLLLATLVAVAAQISLGLFVPAFKISLGGVLFPFILYLLPEVGAISLGFLSGLGVYGLRVLGSLAFGGSLQQELLAFYPEVFFYLAYGSVFAFLTRHQKPTNAIVLFPIAIISDFSANLVEMAIRSISQPTSPGLNMIGGLFFVAIFRSSLLWLILQGMERYKQYVLQRERYQKLLWLTSRLKTEMFWMRKNMDQIEGVMAKSYSLFEKITQNEARDRWANLSISIAREVHEIKKEYGLVLRGLEEALGQKLNDPGMDWHTILTLLKDIVFQENHFNNDKISVIIIPGPNFITTQHYYLLSIFRNLLVNAQESLQEGSSLGGTIRLEHEEHSDYHVFRVEDNGEGIEPADWEHIFSPGFSTKIDYSTGQIHRGLGLSLVKELIEEKLQGEISVQSTPNQGTVFLLKMPKSILELNE